jgi:hypothetical protein
MIYTIIQLPEIPTHSGRSGDGFSAMSELSVMEGVENWSGGEEDTTRGIDTPTSGWRSG